MTRMFSLRPGTPGRTAQMPRTQTSTATPARELLALQMPQVPAAQRTAIVETLLFGYHSHDYTLTGDDLAAIGLTVHHDPALEAAAWEVTRELRTRMGPETRKSRDRGWCDALIATRDGGFVRTRQQDLLPGDWNAFGTA